jgi:hypothetical protein
MADALTLTIAAYSAGLADYNRNCPVGIDAAMAYIDATYGPPYALLERWNVPATSAGEALLALDTAIAEMDEMFGERGMITALMRAAAEYLRARPDADQGKDT